MQYLFDMWQGVGIQIATTKNILLLFDYDGTLTPIVERPELAELSRETRNMLNSLSRKSRTVVGIISGRSINDLRNRIGLNSIVYAGNHGLEIEGPGIKFLHPVAEEIKTTLSVLYTMLRKALTSVDGTFIEDKGLTLSVHYRQVEEGEKQGEVKTAFEKITGVARMLGRVRTTSGKKVYEVRPPVAWDKGKAVKMLMKDYGKGDVLPIYVGDDLTDEDAFTALRDSKGITVYVGGNNPDFSAKYYLNSTEEVEQLLKKLNNLL